MDAVGVTATSGSTGAVDRPTGISPCHYWWIGKLYAISSSPPSLRNSTIMVQSDKQWRPSQVSGISPPILSVLPHAERLFCHHNIAQLMSLLTGEVLTLATAVLREGSTPIISSSNSSGLALILHQRARGWLLTLKRRLTAHIHIHVFKGQKQAYLENTEGPGLPLAKGGTTIIPVRSLHIPTLERLTPQRRVGIVLFQQL